MPRPPRTYRVLLVEDDEIIAAGLVHLLASEGHLVDSIQLGAEAVDAAERFRPEVVVLDVGLPDVNGVDVFRRLRARWPQLPVIFSTGHVQDLAQIGVEGEEHVLVLQKPYEIDEILAAITEVAGG